MPNPAGCLDSLAGCLDSLADFLDTQLVSLTPMLVSLTPMLVALIPKLVSLPPMLVNKHNGQQTNVNLPKGDGELPRGKTEKRVWFSQLNEEKFHNLKHVLSSEVK